MPNNPEFTPSNAGELDTSRETLGERGNKTLEAELEDLNRRHAEVLARLKQKRAELDALNAKEISAEEAPEIPEDAPEVGPVEEPTPIETPVDEPSEALDDDSEQEKQGLIARIKANPNFKKFAAATIGILAAAIAIGGIAGSFRNNRENTAVEAFESQNKEKGIKDGYDQKGMWLSENKGTSVDFGCAEEVAEVCKVNGEVDECEMIKYTAKNQTESFADYLANLPEQLQPEGFKGLSILEAEKKIESLSDEEYDALKKQFDETIDKAFTRRTVLNGEHHNAYMSLKDANGGVNHENMKLVACTTNESNLEVNQFYWTDEQGREIGNMTIKITPVYDENGSIIGYKGCLQVVSENAKAYEGMEEIQNPENPESEKKAPKDAENLKRIDNKINQDIAKDIGTGKVIVHQEPAGSLTERPSPELYKEYQPVQNEQSQRAETVTPQNSANSYSENRGGANASNAEVRVAPNEAGQAAADQNKINQAAPANAENLRGLGIN